MGDSGKDPPLFLDQTEAQRAEKNFFQDHPPSLSQGLDDCFPPYSPSPSPLSEVLDPPLQVYHILFLISSVVFSLQG